MVVVGLHVRLGDRSDGERGNEDGGEECDCQRLPNLHRCSPRFCHERGLEPVGTLAVRLFRRNDDCAGCRARKIVKIRCRAVADPDRDGCAPRDRRSGGGPVRRRAGHGAVLSTVVTCGSLGSAKPGVARRSGASTRPAPGRWRELSIRMNILMLSDVYFPRVNGVSTSMQTFCRELVRLGHRVTIVAPDYGIADADAEFEIIRLPSRRIFFDPEDRLIRKSAVRTIVRRARVPRVGRHPHPHAVSRASDRRRARQEDRPADRRELPHVLRGIRRELPAVVSVAAAALLRAALFATTVREASII